MEKRVSPSSIKDGKVIRCKSENHVPLVAVSEELRIPDVLSKAAGDRLHIAGASGPGDWSRKVLQSDVPSQENRTHISCVQAPGDPPHKVPEWLQPLKECPSGDPPDPHHEVVEQPVVEPKQ